MAIDVQMKMASPRIKEKSAFTTTTDEQTKRTSQTRPSSLQLLYYTATNLTQAVPELQLLTYLITHQQLLTSYHESTKQNESNFTITDSLTSESQCIH